MLMQNTVSRIQTDTIDKFLGEDRPLLMAVLCKDSDLLEHLRQLMDVAMEIREEVLVACYTLEDLLPYLSERFGVGGTPTYLMIEQGSVQGSLLGRNSSRTLLEFIHQHIGKHAHGTRTDGKKPEPETIHSKQNKRIARGVR